jgi:hypothetical protein
MNLRISNEEKKKMKKGNVAAAKEAFGFLT